MWNEIIIQTNFCVKDIFFLGVSYPLIVIVDTIQ